MEESRASQYLTSSEVGRIFGVTGKTVDRWADAGRIGCIVTLGKHRRFHPDEVQRLVDEMQVPARTAES
jgi:excisionase family DNA binding protein